MIALSICFYYSLFRVAWYPHGLYHHQKRERSRRLCYTLLILCVMAGAAALIVSWLLATGNIDPSQKIINKTNSKVPRRLDFFSDKNSIKFSEDEKYPKIVSQKNLERDLQKIKEKDEEAEEGSGEDPLKDNMFLKSLLEGSLEAGEVEISDNENNKKDQASLLEMENFELSQDEQTQQEEIISDETTLAPDEDLEITTTFLLENK